MDNEERWQMTGLNVAVVGSDPTPPTQVLSNQRYVCIDTLINPTTILRLRVNGDGEWTLLLTTPDEQNDGAVLYKGDALEVRDKILLARTLSRSLATHGITVNEKRGNLAEVAKLKSFMTEHFLWNWADKPTISSMSQQLARFWKKFLDRAD